MPEQTPVETAVIDAITASMNEHSALDEARKLIDSLNEQGWRIQPKWEKDQDGPIVVGVTVADVGGGEIRCYIDRDAKEYPPIGADGLLCYFVRPSKVQRGVDG